MTNIPINIVYQGMLLNGHADPIGTIEWNVPTALMIYIQGWCIGTLRYSDHKWSMDKPIDPSFVESLGKYIYSYMRSARQIQWQAGSLN
jgi:hypothetical protein